ncbi:SafA/ExsA family spore coat assembly protein [Bacillus horti]|uniref:Spore coat assembly protein SafA n=1 Tax=Caldalkalibacillus horti TaxID=77523 RepID=A0ABT9VTE7_9BACI|nr:SafA/ExsA family spore coat assembly protein [Bacillus horti]MDQ0164260.1 spore coat assembly protein SafA [Bacillus horti]
MKIHIVQKGDTLWKLAEQYGVNFEELKKANSQLSNPDLIMPGMKIKIPTGAVPAKHQHHQTPHHGQQHHGQQHHGPQHHGQQHHGQQQIGQMHKKEMPKTQPIAQAPKMEVPKMEIPKVHMPKMEVPKIDENRLRQMIREAVAEQLPGVLRSLLHHLKPEIINQIKIDLELSKTEINVAAPTPLPIKKEKPMPYKPEVKPVMEAPCPPFPPIHHHHHGMWGHPMPHHMGGMTFDQVQGMQGFSDPAFGAPQQMMYSPMEYMSSPGQDQEFGQPFSQFPEFMEQQNQGFESWSPFVEQPLGWGNQPFQEGSQAFPYGGGYPGMPMPRQTIQDQHHHAMEQSGSSNKGPSGTQALEVREANGEDDVEVKDEGASEATGGRTSKTTKSTTRSKTNSRRSKR